MNGAVPVWRTHSGKRCGCAAKAQICYLRFTEAYEGIAEGTFDVREEVADGDQIICQSMERLATNWPSSGRQGPVPPLLANYSCDVNCIGLSVPFGDTHTAIAVVASLLRSPTTTHFEAISSVHHAHPTILPNIA